MGVRNGKVKERWLADVLESMRCLGYAVVEGILGSSFVETTKNAMYEVQKRIIADLGKERLDRAGELGVLRLMMKYHPHFFRFLEIPEVLAIVDHTVSAAAVMHLQNGFILPSCPKDRTPDVFQNRFHPDFRRVLNGYMVSVNIMFAIDDFSRENGGTLIVPGTHQKEPPADQDYMEQKAIAVTCPKGSMFVFDSTLWHAAGVNISGKDRLAINHQFTRSYIKQQIDYVRALGDEVVLAQNPRTQQLLGWYTRVVTSLNEYYLPQEERLYRKGQG
ncbi:MAG: phytanoyl-CoA dioxygenase family protein [Candidatus Omnitrophota bacterium]|nr:phytanoyl-CoA dioxygenase family protein [Candidatus Omnitrophota bacterium]